MYEAVAIARTQAPDAFSPELGELVGEGRHCSTQDFTADERGVFWKCVPTSTYISSLESIKDARVGGKANGDNKLMQLFVYSNKNQGTMKKVDISLLPVNWKSLRKAWKMRHILRHCCEDYLL